MARLPLALLLSNRSPCHGPPPSRAATSYAPIAPATSRASNSGREATVLCAPRPRRIQIHPCSADLILSPPHFLLTSNTTNKEVAAHKAAAPVLRDRASEPERSSARGNLAISKKFSPLLTQKL
uniref:Uncharacterized protein n=1 Tax=Oryza nivara TaxID=4536 RepID=A0A0E0IB99_ORYNI